STHGYQAEAFETSERERAQSLIDLLRESHVDIRRGVDPALVAVERDRQRQLDFWSSRLAALANGNGTDEQVQDIQRRVSEALRAYRETEARIRTISPAYAALTRPPTFGAVEIQRQLLDRRTVLLRFVLGDLHSYAWLVT